MQGCAVDRLIVFERFHGCPGPDIEQSQVSILTSCVNEILLFPKTANRGHIPFEIAIIRPEMLIGPFQVVHLRAVVHPDYDLALVLGDFDAIGSRCELDGLSRVAGAVGRVPKLDGVVIGTAGQFQSHSDKMIREQVSGGKHHFFVLNLLILGITTDSNFLPTLLPVDPVSAMVSTLPVKTFYLPILNSTQLSFFVNFSCCFRAGLEEVSRGESQFGYDGFLLSSWTVSPSSSRSASPSAKQGWLSAQAAEMRSCGFFLSIFPSRFKALGSIDLYQSPQSKILLALFCASTSLQVFPGNALTPSSSIWKMSPKLKISQIGSYLVFISLMLMTYGATQPGVPHLTKRYSCASENSASPKSAIAHSKLPSALKRMFQGFKSRCMIFLLCISLSPCRMVKIAVLTSMGLNLYLALTLSQSCPPSSSSTTIYREFSDQKTSYNFMQFLWLRFLITSISLIRHSLPLSSEQAASFEKAFTAQLFPSSNFSARQTEAKLPFPIFFLGLNCSWNPLWLIFALRVSLHCCRSWPERSTQTAFCSPFQKAMEGGESSNENLTSKSKGRQTFDLLDDSTKQCQQIEAETSPQSRLLAWQEKSSLPIGPGGWLQYRSWEISMFLKYIQH